jgi:hypothetical protein
VQNAKRTSGRFQLWLAAWVGDSGEKRDLVMNGLLNV